MGSPKGPLDRELNFRAIVGLTLGLLVLLIVAAAGMWLVSIYLRGLRQADDPPPPALPEARIPYQPPAPRLQAEPLTDIQRLREREELELTTYDWVDQEAGVARIPIERAMSLLVENGIPESTAGGDMSRPVEARQKSLAED